VTAHPAVIGCIGGIDTSGGAGLARDAITVAGLHGQCWQVPTLVSQQSHQHHHATYALDCQVFAQALSILVDALPAAIKLGAIANDAQAQCILDQLTAIPATVPVIWDPVQISSAHGRLGQLSQSLINTLLTRCTLVTPNLPELGLLSGQSDSTLALSWLRANGPQYLLVKGGHAQHAQATDILYSPAHTWHFAGPRVPDIDMRGSGCITATAIACFMAKGYNCEDAVCLAKAVLSESYHTARPVAATQALAPAPHWPENADYFPVTQRNTALASSATGFGPLDQPYFGLYPVVDSIDWLQRVLAVGVSIAQLRIKATNPDILHQQVHQAVALGRQYQSQVFINDHWQLAIEAGAYGVHLGQDDLTTADLAAIANAGLRLGVSTHGYAELCRVLPLTPSYIALGHVYPTTTKRMPSQPQGPARLAAYQALCGSIPTVAIGGIGLAQIPSVRAAGVHNVAVVSAITRAANPPAAIAQLQEALANVQRA